MKKNLSEKMYTEITFISCKKVVWNYEKQVTELRNVLSFDSNCGLHGSWLNSYINRYRRTYFLKERGLKDKFIYCDENKFSFYEEDLIEVLEFIEIMHTIDDEDEDC